MTIEISTELVSNLIKSQFIQYRHLSIKPVQCMGHDNRTFHLGDEMLVRMPSAEAYSTRVRIEQEWLPKLAKNISLSIPKPLHMGVPSKIYPWNWSIYKWIEGKSINAIDKNILDLNVIAKQLATFVNELHKIDITNAPMAGMPDCSDRGCHVSIYNHEARVYIDKLKDVIDSKRALQVWEVASNSKWEKAPVWIHGDLAVGNILIKDNQINAVIDFGGMSIGDPACDLVMYWNFFDSKGRDVFKSELKLDESTWNRARGWALWKACFEVVDSRDLKSRRALSWLEVIDNTFSF